MSRRIRRLGVFVFLATLTSIGMAQESLAQTALIPYKPIGTSLMDVADASDSSLSTQVRYTEVGWNTGDSEAAQPSPSSALSESEIEKIVDRYLKEKEASKEASMTAKEKKDRDLAMSAKWNDGLELSTKDKQFRTHVGGRFQFDNAWFQTPGNVNNAINVPYGDGADFRRARLRVDGTLYGVHEYAAEFDFVNAIRVRGQPGTTGFFDEAITAPTDLWWTVKELPIVGNMRIGNHKEAIGFEHLVSSRFQPFMERSYNQDTFYGGLYNGFQPGVSIFNTYGDEVGTWNIGLFKPTNNIFASGNGDGDYSVTGRVTRLLHYEDDGKQLLHFGVSGRQASAIQQAGVPGRFQVYRTRDAVRSGLSAGWPTPANITVLGDDQQWANGELVGVMGSWTFQSEYLVSSLQDARLAAGNPGSNLVYHGGYVQLLYFLTGEHDHYSKKSGVFERVKPHTNFFKPNKCDGSISGMGAWQVGVRYNHLDLNDEGINGGILDNFVAGLNWYWNPNMKWQFNYSATDRDVAAVANPAINTGSGTIHGFGTRMAIDF